VPKPTPVAGREDVVIEAAQKARGVSGAAVESVAPRRRRRFAAAEKLRILEPAEVALASGERGALEALLRKEGIYSSHLSAWRQQLAAKGSEGLAARKPGRKPNLDAKDRELLAVKKKNADLEQKLNITNAVIALQKKSTCGAGPRAADSGRGRHLMVLVEQRDAFVPVAVAREALGVGRATLYRSRRLAPPRAPSRPRPSPTRRLSDEERQRVLDVLHRPEFADQPPTEVYATLLERGEYVGSIRTMYRVLAAAGEVRERRNVRAARVHAVPSLTATAPKPGLDVGHHQARDGRQGRLPSGVRHHRSVQPFRRRLAADAEGLALLAGRSLPRGSPRSPAPWPAPWTDSKS
jgi:transposase-like protein